MARTTASTTPDSSDYHHVGSRPPLFKCSYSGCSTPVSLQWGLLCDKHAKRMGVGEKLRVDFNQHEASERWHEPRAHTDAIFSLDEKPAVKPSFSEDMTPGQGPQNYNYHKNPTSKATSKKTLASETKLTSRKTTSKTTRDNAQRRSSTTNHPRQTVSPASPDISSRRPLIHSPPDSPSQSDAPVRKKPKLLSNGHGNDQSHNHEIHYESFISSVESTDSFKMVFDEAALQRRNGSVNGVERQPLNPTPDTYLASESRSTSWKVGSAWPMGIPTSAEIAESVDESPAASVFGLGSDIAQHSVNNLTSGRQFGVNGTSPKTPESKQVPVRLNQRIADITDWFSRKFDYTPESLDTSYTQSLQENVAIEPGSAYGVSTPVIGTPTATASRDAAKKLKRSAKPSTTKKASPGLSRSKTSKAVPQRQRLPLRKESSRKISANNNTPAIIDYDIEPPPLEKERLRLIETHSQTSLDALIYSQKGASAPPRGVVVPPKSDKPQPRDAPFFAHIDPRIHWNRQRSMAWQEAKQQEIKMRGGPKANFGRSAERMADQRRKEGRSVLQDRLPEQFSSDPAWIQAVSWFEEVDKIQWEKDKEATRQLEIQEQLECDASSRLGRGMRDL